MTQQQLLIIEDYLVLFRVPLDLLMELKDHMSSQVQHLMINKHLTFEEAFRETKIAWDKDLRPVRFRFFFSEEIPFIVKETVKVKYYQLLKQSFILICLSVLFMVFVAFVSPTSDTFAVFFRCFNGLFALTPIVLWLFNNDLREFSKLDFKYQGKIYYTLYQKNLGILLYSTIYFINILQKDGAYIFNFIKTGDAAYQWGCFTTLLMVFAAQFIIVFGLLNFIHHRKILKKLQEFSIVS